MNLPVSPDVGTDMIRTRADGWSFGEGSKPVLDMSASSTSYECLIWARSSKRNNTNRKETGATKTIAKNQIADLRKRQLTGLGPSVSQKGIRAAVAFREKFPRTEIVLTSAPPT